MDHPSKSPPLLLPAFRPGAPHKLRITSPYYITRLLSLPSRHSLADSSRTNSEKQISHVIHLLTEGSPADQKRALDTYFLPDASFLHPLCRVPSFSKNNVPLLGEIDSRWVLWMIYRWYKILSPRILLDVECSGSYPSFCTRILGMANAAM
jgi:hypothetical protein